MSVKKVNTKEIMNDGTNDGINDGKKLDLNSRKNLIINIIKENDKITRKEIISKIGISKATLERDLAALRKDNKIEYIGSSKNGKWIIKE